MKKVWTKIKLFMREMLNLLTNLFCPVVSAICALMELFQLPTSAINAVKNVEHWFWNIAGTKDKIEEIIDKVDDAVEKTDSEHQELNK